jgi:hypothetical protein
MSCAYNFAPGRRGASTQIVIDGLAACAGIARTVAPAIAAAAAAATIEYFFFKVFPLCRPGDGSLLAIDPVAKILGVGILFRIVFPRNLLVRFALGRRGKALVIKKL